MSSRMPAARALLAVLLCAVLCLATAGPVGAADSGGRQRWLWPVMPPGRVVAPYQAPPGPYAPGHRGIDVEAPADATVLSPANAVVIFSGTVVDRPVVTLQVADDVLLSMEPVASDIAVGESVGRGQAIGTVAHGGHCDGRCVHIGVRVDAQYVSPLLYFATVPPAVLLPLGDEAAIRRAGAPERSSA